MREEFAKTCFETLLQFSLLDGLNNEIDLNKEKMLEDEGGVAGRLAVTTLLHRFQEVLKRYIEDEKRSGKCPLPRYYQVFILFIIANFYFQVCIEYTKITDSESKNIYYGSCSRYRLSEISFVLKAVATLVVSLKKAPANKGEFPN